MRIAEGFGCRPGALAVAALVLVSCGGAPSGSHVTAVQGSHYTCKADVVFEAVVQAVEKEFKAAKTRDPAGGSVIAETQWFDASGAPRDPLALQDGDIAVVARAQITDLKPNYRFAIDAVVKTRVGNDPEPRDLSGPRPAWIQAKLDSVTVDADKRLEACAVLSRDLR